MRMHDLVGTELPLTQEFLAQMMGVQRTSVNLIASHLQKDGLILPWKSTILDINLVQKRACESHRSVGTRDRRIR